MSYPILLVEHWQLPECVQVRAKSCGKDDAFNRLICPVLPDHTITRHLMEHVFVPNCRIPDDCIDSKRYPLFIGLLPVSLTPT